MTSDTATEALFLEFIFDKVCNDISSMVLLAQSLERRQNNDELKEIIFKGNSALERLKSSLQTGFGRALSMDVVDWDTLLKGKQFTLVQKTEDDLVMCKVQMQFIVLLFEYLHQTYGKLKHGGPHVEVAVASSANGKKKILVTAPWPLEDAFAGSNEARLLESIAINQLSGGLSWVNEEDSSLCELELG